MKIRTMLLFFILSLNSSVAFSRFSDGNDGGHGGDEVALEFGSMARLAFYNINNEVKYSSGDFTGVKDLNPEVILGNVAIYTVEERLYVKRDGIDQEVVALNFPQRKLVKINRTRWNAISDPHLKEAIAFHEAISLAGFEDTAVYKYSAQYLAANLYPPDAIYNNPNSGPAKPIQLNKIFSYKCRRTFFQGEGVNPNHITCNPNQSLSFLHADYTYYLFKSRDQSNFDDKTTRLPFDTNICSMADVTKISCESEPKLEFGLAKEMISPFNVLVTLTAKPDATPRSATTGYAALPDAFGNCPKGLEKARPFIAQPPSVTKPLPSNFLNNGSLNNTIVSTETEIPTFLVWRKNGFKNCDYQGSCGAPSGNLEVATYAEYSPLTPVICVVPRTSITE